MSRRVEWYLETAAIAIVVLLFLMLVAQGLRERRLAEAQQARNERLECLNLLSFMQTPSDSLRFLVVLKRCNQYVGTDSLERMVAR